MNLSIKFRVCVVVILGGFFLPLISRALTISPPLFDVSGNPGDVILQRIKVLNETAVPLRITIALNDFSSNGDEQGTPKFFAPITGVEMGLTNWLSLNKSDFTLKSKESRELPFAINIPKNATPGGYYGAIVLSSSAVNVNAGVGVGSQIASLILLRVNGVIKEEARISSFLIERPFPDSLPVNFTVRLENTGNAHLKPSGEIIIRNMLGLVTKRIQFNSEGGNILPQSARAYSSQWAYAKDPISNPWLREIRNFGFGSYSVEAKINYGQSQQTLNTTGSFTIWPRRLIISTVTGLILLAGFIFMRRKRG